MSLVVGFSLVPNMALSSAMAICWSTDAGRCALFPLSMASEWRRFADSLCSAMRFQSVIILHCFQYMERFEKSFGTKIHHDDRAQLNQLTSSTLFCRSVWPLRSTLSVIAGTFCDGQCFQPINEERFEEELTSPFIALTDIISVGLLPIALLLLVIILLPIVFILPLLPIKWSQDEDDDDDDDE